MTSYRRMDQRDAEVFQLVTQLERAGAQSMAKWLDSALGENGLRVTTRFLYLKNAAKELFDEGACLAPSRKQLLAGFIPIAFRIRSDVRNASVAIGHTHFSIVLLGFLTPRATRLVFVHHWPESRYPLAARIGLFAVRSLRREITEISVSPAAQSEHVSQVIPNPVPAPAAASCGARSDSGVDILCVARHSAEKGIDTLIRTMLLCPTRSLTLIGTGRLTSELTALVRSLGIEDRVHFLGAVPGGQVRRAMQECSIFVLPSRWEAMPMAILEAIAEDCLLVVSEIPAHKFVLDCHAALGFRLDDEVDLADALDRAPVEAVRLAAGRAHIKEIQGEVEIAKRWQDVISTELELATARRR